jgi:16S rRNA processing protein RimM
VFFAHKKFSAGFHALGKVGVHIHDDLALQPMRTTQKTGRKLFVGEEHKLMTLAGVRPHQSGLLVQFKGVDTSEDAGLYRNQWVFIKAGDAPPLPEGQLYQYELIGFKVIDDGDNLLGELVEILETGANDVYIVRDDSGREILLPAIPSVILDLQPALRVIRVHVLEGL